MHHFRLAVFCAVLAFGRGAWATTLGFDSGSVTAVDPTLDFEADCLADTPADDCPTRAAALETELLDLLAQLYDDSDPETVALFQSIVDLNDPRLKEVALQYLAKEKVTPDSLMGQVHDFFFGPDATLGQPAASILGQSADAAEQELSRVYLEGRGPSDYAGDLPQGAGFTDSWAIARAKDTFIDEHASFTDDELFPDATRLLMVDRLRPSLFGGMPSDPATELPVTGFVTQAPIADVESFFSALFGADPYPPSATSQARLMELNTELLSLTKRLSAGDQTAAARLQEISKELPKVQQASQLGALLNLEQLGCADHEFWTDGSLASTTSPRAVTVGYDARVDATVIRYIGGEVGDAATGNGAGGAGNDGSGAAGTATGGDAADAPSSKHSDSGCSCSVPPTRAPASAPLWLLGLLTIWRLRRPRRRWRAS